MQQHYSSISGLSEGGFRRTRNLRIDSTHFSFTSPVPLAIPFSFTVTLSGHALAFSGPNATFISPAGAAATASFGQSRQVLKVHLHSFGDGSVNQSVPALTPVIFTFGNVTFLEPAGPVTGIPSSVLGSNGRCLTVSYNGIMAATPRMRWVFVCGTASNGWSCD